MEVPIKVSGLGTEYYKTKEGYRLEYENGIIEYIDNNDRLHRTDGPAFEHPDGYKEWYVNGEQMTGEQFNRWRAKHNPIKESRAENLKRLASIEVPYQIDDDGTEFFKTKDGYRVEWPDGSTFWYDINDRLHRVDGPAFDRRSDGHKQWFVNGKLHRLDGPAVEHPGGSKEWWVHGKHHRIDGPAVDINNVNVEKEWYVNGKQMSEEQFNQWRARHNPIKESRIENLKQLASMEIPYRVYGDGTEVYKTKEGFRYENPNGSKEWYVNGELHRIDGPAIEVANGDRFWYVNGERHRTDGPAVEQADGRKAWFVNDKRHRTDGPAIEFADGRKAWYIHGKKMSEKQFDKWRAKNNPIKESRIENIKQLASIEVPFKVDNDGTETYKTKDGYRVEWPDCIIWYDWGWLIHRTDGPAVEYADGDTAWYINNKKMSEEQFNQWRAKNNPIKESRSENIKQLASMEVPYKVDNDGTETYKTKDGYRVESAVGNIFWFNNNGERHRVDGPAVEFVDGSKYWYVNNKQHRIDGPAYIGANGTKIWYVNGKEMRENTFDKWRAKHNPIK